MGKKEFLDRLERLLGDISQEEREEAVTFYRSYFDEAGLENEAFVIEELGSPEKAAEAIKRDLGMIAETGYKQTGEHMGQNQQNYDDGQMKTDGKKKDKNDFFGATKRSAVIEYAVSILRVSSVL